MKFSVVICNYNMAGFLHDAISSVLANNDQDCEIIVVDDGSKDNSHEVIQSFSTSGVKSVLKANGGQASAFNAGVAAASGDVILLLDGDDFLFPYALQRIRKVIEEQKLLGTPFMIRYCLTRCGDDLPHEWRAERTCFTIDGPIVLRADEVRHHSSPESTQAAVEFASYPAYSGPGGNSSTFSREMASLIFPTPENLSKYYGDHFPVIAAPLVGNVFIIGEILGGRRFHKSNHSTSRPTRVSLNFIQGVEAYLNGILERTGKSYRVSYLDSLAGARYLAARGQAARAIRNAWKRTLKRPKSTQLANFVKTCLLVSAIRLHLVPHETRDEGD